MLKFSKTGNNNLTEAFKDNVVLDYAGAGARNDRSVRRGKAAWSLAELYVEQHGRGHARVKMEEVNRHLDDTWFRLDRRHETDSVFYYRIHSPVILIEFDHQRPANLAQFAADPKSAVRAAYSLRSAHAEWQRLRQGFAAAALPGASAYELKRRRRRSK